VAEKNEGNRKKQNKVASIFDLNAKANPTERLPFLWIIQDEFAEWMMTEDYADAVANIVGRLGVKARAAGIPSRSVRGLSGVLGEQRFLSRAPHRQAPLNLNSAIPVQGLDWPKDATNSPITRSSTASSGSSTMSL